MWLNLSVRPPHLLAWSPRHQPDQRTSTWYWTSMLWSIDSRKIGHLLTSVTRLYRGSRFLIHWGDVLFKFSSCSDPFFWEELNFLLAFGEGWIVSRKTLVKRFHESFWPTRWFWHNYSWRKIKVRNKIDYYSFKIFFCFWLFQIPQLILHN